MNFLSLSFLAPAALLGLLAIAIPLYLHMRHKPRAEVFKFPAIDFLLKAQKKRKRRFRVEQWLLMLFRILVILILAFLFARPFMEDRQNNAVFGSDRPLVVILDDSASMTANAGDGSFFQSAVEQLDDLLRGRGDAPTYLLLASSPQALADRTTGRQIREAIPQLMPTTYAATLDEAYGGALDLARSQGWEQATVRIFTDGSRSAWRELPSEKPEALEVIYTSLRDNRPIDNLGITRVTQAPGDINSIEVSVFNGGLVERDVRLRLEGNESLTHQMRIDGEGSAIHRFGLQDPLPPNLRLAVSGDAFALDDEVMFAPKNNRRIRVLIVDGDTHPDPVRNESFFFRNALGGEDSAQYGYQIEVVTPAGLDAAKVEAHDVLCLLNVDAPPTDLLTRALQTGKGVFIAMGERMDFEAWNLYLSQHQLEVYEVQKLPQAMPLEIRQADHPLFAGVDGLVWSNYMDGAFIERLRVLSQGRATFETPITLSDGRPVLLTRSFQQNSGYSGRLVLWASAMDLDWNNFPLQFGFVPFSRQLTSYLAGRESATAFTTYTTNEVRDKDLLDQLILKTTSDTVQSLNLKGPKPGVYTRAGDGDRTEFVHVQLPAEESDFRSFGGPDTAEAQSSLEDLGFRSYVRADLGPALQWWLFAFILFETVLAARISQRWGSR